MSPAPNEFQQLLDDMAAVQWLRTERPDVFTVYSNRGTPEPVRKALPPADAPVRIAWNTRLLRKVPDHLLKPRTPRAARPMVKALAAQPAPSMREAFAARSKTVMAKAMAGLHAGNLTALEVAKLQAIVNRMALQVPG